MEFLETPRGSLHPTLFTPRHSKRQSKIKENELLFVELLEKLRGRLRLLFSKGSILLQKKEQTMTFLSWCCWSTEGSGFRVWVHLRRVAQQSRGLIVFKAYRLSYHSSVGSRATKMKKKKFTSFS